MQLLNPFAPHMTEELWKLMGFKNHLAKTDWPHYDETIAALKTIEIPIQVNGKVRGRITIDADASKEEIENTAMNTEIIKRWTEGKTIRKVIVIPERLINIVVSG